MALCIRNASEIAALHGAEKLVLVASRRTDMPRFHVDEIVDGLTAGALHPQAPMQAMYELRFQPGDIHSVGLWSQDFSRWIPRRSQVQGYRFSYRFTILPDDPVTKPRAPRVADQLSQLASLLEMEPKEAVQVFIDPLVRYRAVGSRDWQGNASREALEPIIAKVAALGIDVVTTSVMDRYKKVERRAAKAGIEFYFADPSRSQDREQMRAMLAPLLELADTYGVAVRSCCEKQLDSEALTSRGGCVAGARLTRLFGAGASLRPDSGQRRTAGCGCTRALDVGRYKNSGEWSHACAHACPQCYARP